MRSTDTQARRLRRTAIESLCPCLLVSVFLSVCLCRLGMIENLSWHFTPKSKS